MKNLKAITLALITASVAALQGCTTHLSQGQERELAGYEAKGIAVKEKSEVAAGILGVLPVVGYLYTGHTVLAFTTLPLYPFLGPLWQPFDTAASAKNRNYYATKEAAYRGKTEELKMLDKRLQDKEINYEQHLRDQRIIEAKFEPY